MILIYHHYLFNIMTSQLKVLNLMVTWELGDLRPSEAKECCVNDRSKKHHLPSSSLIAYHHLTTFMDIKVSFSGLCFKLLI